MEQQALSSKRQVKQIIDRIENIFQTQAKIVQRHCIKVFPENDATVPDIELPFSNKTYRHLQTTSDIMSNVVYQYGHIEAAKSFFQSVGISVSDDEKSTDSRCGILHFTVDGGETSIFLMKIDSDEFTSLYSDDQIFFEYMLGTETHEFHPCDRDLRLAYSILSNNRLSKKTVIIVVNNSLQYTGADFSEAGKAYISKRLQNTSKHLMGNIEDLNLDIKPFDYYFNSLRAGLAVNYFISRLKDVIQTHSITMNNIGKLLYSDASEIVTQYALASNNHVGTVYFSEKIHELQESYARLPKPQTVLSAPHANPEYRKIFQSISSKASKNLKWLEDPRLCRPLLTAEWIFNNISDIEGFDNTFICFGYLKLVEILLSKILIEDYNGHEMSVSPAKSITVSRETENQMMLGNMIRFATRSYSSELKKSEFCCQITNALVQWKNDIRNGYFHKHLMDRDAVASIRNHTFEVIYMILGTLPK